MFELKELTLLQIRLEEEKGCRDVLASLLKKNPVEYYEQFRAALEHARKLEFDPAKEPLVVDTQRLFDSVKDRIEVRYFVAMGDDWIGMLAALIFWCRFNLSPRCVLNIRRPSAA